MERSVENRFIGTAMMVLCSLFFALTALFVRLGSETVPVGLMVLARFLFMAFTLIILKNVGLIVVKPVNKRLLFYRSVFASVGGIFYFFSIATITIAEAIILKYTFPVFAVTIAALIYGEKVSRTSIVVLAVSLLGVVVMMNPASFHPSAGYAWGVLNGLSAGMAVAFLRELRKTDDSSTVLYYHSLAGVAVSLPFLVNGIVIPGVKGGVYMLLAALFGLLAQFTMVYGFKHVKTTGGSVLMTLEVVLSALLAFLFLGQMPGMIKIVGGIMIIAGAIYVSSEGKFRKNGAKELNEGEI
jgi:drug/metabolite transporter (DMT)-like permease